MHIRGFISKGEGYSSRFVSDGSPLTRGNGRIARFKLAMSLGPYLCQFPLCVIFRSRSPKDG